MRDAERVLQYQYFNYENAFPGLSEYRYFDMRSLLANGLGVARLSRQSTPTQVELLPEATRNGLAYNQYIDANGQRVFQNREYGNGAYNSDYAEVTFNLKAPRPAPGPVYVFGALSDWQFKDEFRLILRLGAGGLHGPRAAQAGLLQLRLRGGPRAGRGPAR
ncbi:MAG: hypothetical protein WKG07_49230 [Hymenobacter sp.]